MAGVAATHCAIAEVKSRSRCDPRVPRPWSFRPIAHIDHDLRSERLKSGQLDNAKSFSLLRRLTVPDIGNSSSS
jgi:hypothetical protein